MDAALRNNGLYFPRGKGVTINLAPADIRKEGTAYDLPLAVGLLAATEQAPAELLETHLVMGELSLDGGVRPIKGALPIALEAKRQGFKGVILPLANAREAAIVNGLEVYGVEHLTEVVALMKGEGTVQPTVVDIEAEFAQSSRLSLIHI